MNKIDIYRKNDKAVNFVPMLQNMGPEDVKKAIEYFPEFTMMVLEEFTEYGKVLEKTLDSNKESNKDCFEIYNRILLILEKCVSQEDISAEEKRICVESIMQIGRMADEKDRENKSFQRDIANIASYTVATSAFVIAAAIIIKVSKKAADVGPAITELFRLGQNFL